MADGELPDVFSGVADKTPVGHRRTAHARLSSVASHRTIPMARWAAGTEQHQPTGRGALPCTRKHLGSGFVPES